MKSQIRGLIVLFAVMLLPANASATFSEASGSLKNANNSLGAFWYYGGISFWYERYGVDVPSYDLAEKQSVVQGVSHLEWAWRVAPSGSLAKTYIQIAKSYLQIADQYFEYSILGYGDYSSEIIFYAYYAQIYISYAMEACTNGS